MPNQNIFPVSHRLLPRSERESSLGYTGAVYWLCGLSGSGKSTLAISLEKFLFENKINSIVLDGDDLRDGICKDLGFSIEDRKENVRRVSEIAKLMSRTGYAVIVSLISPTIEMRKFARKIIGEKDSFQIFIKSSFEKCQERDVKGLYADSQNGKIKSFTGKDSIFEEPDSPWMVLDTENEKLQESTSKLCQAVLKQTTSLNS